MSVPLTRFGALTGNAGADARIQIGGKGRKNVLAVVASYQPQLIAAPAATFQGRLVIVDGQLDPLLTQQSGFNVAPPNFAVATDFSRLGKVLFDVLFSGVGPHVFFMPIAQQEGSPQSDEDSLVNIILCIGQDATWVPPFPNPPTPPPGATLYVPCLSASGQTVFGGILAGQTTFGGVPQ
jgi:hypothetical protein